MDEIIRMMTGDGMVKAVAVTGKDMVERARQIHKTLPVATAALGRTLMAASMMGDMLKEEDGSVTPSRRCRTAGAIPEVTCRTARWIFPANTRASWM